ncbi:MAG TPA: calcium-binding protein, partial [Mycobacteriales bacterium]|nr:calcium-binding protein [Mycobacteriales bacterium]
NIISDGGSGADILTGGQGTDYLFASGPGTKTIDAGDGNDVVRHTGTGTATIHGGAGNDQIFGSTGTDQLYGEGGDDLLTGPAGLFDGGAGNDKIVVTIDGGQTPSLDGGDDTDTLYLTLSDSADALTISVPSANLDWLTLHLNGVDRTAKDFENVNIDGRAGADNFVVNDLSTSTDLAALNLDLGQRHTVVGTTTVTTAGGSTIEIPNDVVSDDNAGDRVTINGSSGADTFTLSYVSPAGGTPNQVQVARTGSGNAYSVDIAHEIRAQGDSLTVNGGDGNDTLDAHGLGTSTDSSTDRIAVTLMGGDGNDTLKGTSFADALDGGLGDDRITGGFGL